MDRPKLDQYTPFVTESDILLADVLGRIQLPPGHYATANERYHTLTEWIEREGSPMRGLVARVYGQGGVSQGSSIAAKATNDEFDVDAMVEINGALDRGPAFVLDLLYHTIRGEPGSRYYDATVRCTRCVQVRYADRMHVDLTPAILQPGTPERQSTIFHHRHETPQDPGKRVIANPYGFTEWFKAATPPEPFLALAFALETRALAMAEAEPLPAQVGPHGMSRALASLQLFKRFRNLRYDRRDGRCPPSVLLAKLVAGHQPIVPTFAAAVLECAEGLRDRFAHHIATRTLIREVNPRCSEDVLTDRWPSSITDQTVWLGDLQHLVRQLTRYVHGGVTLTERQTILADLFGEQAARGAVLQFAERMGRGKELGQNRYQPGTGRLVLPAAAAIIPSSTRARPVPATSYFGGPTWRG